MGVVGCVVEVVEEVVEVVVETVVGAVAEVIVGVVEEVVIEPNKFASNIFEGSIFAVSNEISMS